MKLAHSWLKATFSMMGTIMGAGLFALPAAFSYVGLWWGTVLFWILAFGALATHLSLTRELLETGDKHRLGYFVGKYFGKNAKMIPAVTYPLHLLSTNYAYILLGGGFLAACLQIFSVSIPELSAIVLFWFLFAAISISGNSAVARAETYITAAMVTALLMLSALQWPAITFDVTGATRSGWAVAMGIFLFAVSGFSGIGEAVQMVGRSRKEAYSAIIVSTMVSAGLSWIFGVAFYLASHGAIGERVIEFNSYVPMAFFWLLPVLGLTGISSSYITASAELKSVFALDFGWTKTLAAVLAYCLPIILLVFVSREFVKVIAFIGSVFIGINAAMICAFAVARKTAPSQKATLVKAAYGLWHSFISPLPSLPFTRCF
ncbi:MAG: aromatic amino acid transport family protein [Patescibacteria group bacterium]